MNDPTMIVAISCFPIRQTCVTDCSFVASMAVAAQYERMFKKRLITKLVVYFIYRKHLCVSSLIESHP